MSAWPVSVTDHAASGLLEIAWADGRTSRLPHAQLRAACRCAACEAGRRRGQEPDAAADLRLAEIRPLGDGLNLVFSDGHGRGIYPWSYLQAL